MPLSPAAPREPLHQRDITLRGFRRTDGLYEVEAHLVDTKSYAFETHDRGKITPGTALHEMWARLTVDDTMLILSAEAVTEAGPHDICPRGAATFGRLAGLRVQP